MQLPIKFLLVVLGFFLFSVSHAQDGVYLTKTDFKNGNLLAADKKSFYTKRKDNNKIIYMKINGQKKEYIADSLYGMKIGDSRYRFDKRCPYCDYKLVATGDFFMWNYIDFSGQYRQFNIRISKEIDSETYDINSEDRLEILVESHKEFKPFLDCIKGSKAKQYMMKWGNCKCIKFEKNPWD